RTVPHQNRSVVLTRASISPCLFVIFENSNSGCWPPKAAPVIAPGRWGRFLVRRAKARRILKRQAECQYCPGAREPASELFCSGRGQPTLRFSADSLPRLDVTS